jgi:hypothetical protein
MVFFAATIFLSAFLLFQVQPLIGRFVLPWFGGSPAVWTTCMLLFQVLLLAGYAYAHFAATRLSRRAQGLTHLALLIVSTVMLPIVPSPDWKPAGDESPTLRILLLLATTIGGPYFVLSTTGPLMQSWFAAAHPGRSPFRLYALSNVGSLLALLSYPLVFEPYMRLGTQAGMWTIGYVAFAMLCGWNAVRHVRGSTPAVAGGASTAGAAVVATGGAPSEGGEPRPASASTGDRLLWLLLSAAASVLLLATTNQLSQDVAVTPLMWIVPLALYLVSFILTFDAPRWYVRRAFGPLLAVSAAAAWYVLERGTTVPIEWQWTVALVTLFAGCMVCHGELVRIKPQASQLTLFYLFISVGGSLGGVVTALVAPNLFSGYWEYQLGLAACCVLFGVAMIRDRRSAPAPGGRMMLAVATVCGCVMLCSALGKQVWARDSAEIERERNFYGLLRVIDRNTPELGEHRVMVHGRIIHGLQFSDATLRRRPTAYYGEESGVGLAIRLHPKVALLDAGPQIDRRLESCISPGLRVGVVGLGAGTIAAYGRAGDHYRFYEINPDVIRSARERFCYLADSAATIEIVCGDARNVMERELEAGRPCRFDVLAIDAFNGDAVPMHLLTRECFRTYFAHLADDGLLALHLSNDVLDLAPVVLGLAAEAGYEVRAIHSTRDPKRGLNENDWVIVTRNRAFLDDPQVRAAEDRRPLTRRPLVWTDDFGSIQQVKR